MPVHAPETSLGRTSACCRGVPCRLSASTAPCVNIGHRPNAGFAAWTISATASSKALDRPWPPCRTSADSEVQPCCENWRYASEKPDGAITRPSTCRAPSMSPDLLSGDKTSVAKAPAASRIASIVSSSRSGKARAVSWECPAACRARTRSGTGARKVMLSSWSWSSTQVAGARWGARRVRRSRRGARPLAHSIKRRSAARAFALSSADDGMAAAIPKHPWMLPLTSW